jgi:hypothetical protein
MNRQRVQVDNDPGQMSSDRSLDPVNQWDVGGACRYRRPIEKLATTLGGVVVALATGIPLTSYLASHTRQMEQDPLGIGLLLVLYVGIFAAYFVVNHKVGVETSRQGVKSVSLTRRAFIEWRAISSFVVDHYTPLSVCVLAEQADGGRVPLTALATWAFSASALYPYRDALNDELRARHESVAHQR